VLFAVIFDIAEFVVLAVAVVQFVMRLANGPREYRVNDIATARGQSPLSHLLPTVTTPANPPPTYT
jgi:hypothetical protein